MKDGTNYCGLFRISVLSVGKSIYGLPNDLLLVMKSNENRLQLIFMQKFVKSLGATFKFAEVHFKPETELSI